MYNRNTCKGLLAKILRTYKIVVINKLSIKGKRRKDEGRVNREREREGGGGDIDKRRNW